eukprot:3287925-Amphidinium_carterae.1
MPFKDIWVTTKLWDSHHGYHKAREALEANATASRRHSSSSVKAPWNTLLCCQRPGQLGAHEAGLR